MSVHLPTLGNPTRATSAISLSSRRSQRSSPSSPCSANDGARRRLERKRALPRPPRPPAAASQRSPASHEVGEHRRPPGRGPPCPRAPGRPGRRRPGRGASCRRPWVPLPARRCGWSRNASSEATLRSATSQTSPPWPPSPPSGPPRATWASRRNATAPAPPSPPLTWSPHSSTNEDWPAMGASSLRRGAAGPTNRNARPRGARCYSVSWSGLPSMRACHVVMSLAPPAEVVADAPPARTAGGLRVRCPACTCSRTGSGSGCAATRR